MELELILEIPELDGIAGIPALEPISRIPELDGIGRNSVNCGIKRSRNWFWRRNQFRNFQQCVIGGILMRWADIGKA
jgi:hypothetical protein